VVTACDAERVLCEVTPTDSVRRAVWRSSRADARLQRLERRGCFGSSVEMIDVVGELAR
jgi:hypothetical protein